jgi:hypothetical protein
VYDPRVVSVALNDDLVKIEAGRVEALGPAAALRLQAREGVFHMVPAPPHLVVMREARADAEARSCRLSGDLTAPGSIVDILGLIAQTGWRGELLVYDEEGARSIYIEQGSVVGATSTVPSERLGQVMYRYGVLTEDQVSACVEAAASALRIGESAVKQGFVQREKLFELMARQTEEIVFGALLVQQGVFYFLDSFDEANLSSRQLFALSTLVRDGVRRMHEMRYFQARIPSSAHVPFAMAGTGSPPAELDATGVYQAIDGKRSVTELCRVLGESEFVVSRALFQLVHHGYVSIKAPNVEPLAAVAVCNEAVALMLRELDAMDEGDEVRTQLAAFAQRGVFKRLFAGLQPADDGTFDARRIIANVEAFKPPAGTEQVSSWLCEYAAYALFLSRPLVTRAQQARLDRDDPGGKELRLSQRVAAVLEPIERYRSKKGSAAGNG